MLSAKGQTPPPTAVSAAGSRVSGSSTVGLNNPKFPSDVPVAALDTSHDRRLNRPFVSVPENKLLSLEKSLGLARLCCLLGSIQAAFGGNPVTRSPCQG